MPQQSEGNAVGENQLGRDIACGLGEGGDRRGTGSCDDLITRKPLLFIHL